MPPAPLTTRLSETITRALCLFTDTVFACGVTFFLALYIHPLARENSLLTLRKSEQDAIDVAIHTVARSIEHLDTNAVLIKNSENRMLPGSPEHRNLQKEQESTLCERNKLCYLLSATRGRLDTDKLIPAVKVLMDHIGLQLNTSALITQQFTTAVVTRDLGDERLPVTKETVKDILMPYGRTDCNLV